jgi:hypothetical protein
LGDKASGESHYFQIENKKKEEEKKEKKKRKKMGIKKEKFTGNLRFATHSFSTLRFPIKAT